MVLDIKLTNMEDVHPEERSQRGMYRITVTEDNKKVIDGLNLTDKLLWSLGDLIREEANSKEPTQ